MPKHDNQNSEKSIRKVILNDLYHSTVINNICIAIKWHTNFNWTAWQTWTEVSYSLNSGFQITGAYSMWSM